jgi:sugar-specific transcriptional regulator TrmB
MYAYNRVFMCALVMALRDHSKAGGLGGNMEFRDECVQTLTLLGLSFNQARVYIALVRSGMSNAQSISMISKVAREHVYRTMTSLQKLGLVEKIITIPTKYKAIPIHDTVSILTERKIKETSELQARTRRLLRNFKEGNARITLQEEEPQFVLIPEKKAGFEKRRNAFENAQKSVDVINSWSRHSSTVYNNAELLNKAMKRGVKIRVITEKPEDENSLLKVEQIFQKNPPHKVKYVLTALSAETTIYDKEEVFIDVSVASRYGECPTLWSNNPCLVAIVQDYFEIMWLAALEEIPEEH